MRTIAPHAVGGALCAARRRRSRPTSTSTTTRRRTPRTSFPSARRSTRRTCATTGRSTFRLKAPEAQRVELAGVAILTALGQQKPVPFQKGADGVWSLTVGPLAPDMYIYHLVVDGVQMADPNNTVAGFTAMPPYSQLVVHGEGPAYYDARDVPHGAVTRHVYHSGVTSGERELYVYTPPGYDRAKTYPVLYLVGGSGDLPHNWIYDGRVNFILDNLLAEGKAVPMVIAIPNNQVVHRNHPRHVELTFATFERELRQHVIPLVEKQYSVRTRSRGAGALRPLDGRPAHDVRGLQEPRPLRLVRRPERGGRGQRDVARGVPERSRREQEGAVPVRGTGHGGGEGAHGRALRGSARGAPEARRPARVLRRRPRRARLGHVAPPRPREVPARSVARRGAAVAGRTGAARRLPAGPHQRPRRRVPARDGRLARRSSS